MSRSNRASSEPRYELYDLAKMRPVAELLKDLQEAQLGTLSCGRQTDDQIRRCDEIIQELENMGYPYDEYADAIQSENAENVATRIYSERMRALGAFAIVRSDGI